ncbi:hypothetical protein [Actinopolymorpha alba]|uniref:hypothetical protein n=1 Tax=Actinopolymorpha alba TaxID=533267 RepID=UPI0012F65810|nr:hypothetical protein [Actinopolymorpha alba]
MPYDSPAATPPSGRKGQYGRAIATILGWHVLAAAAFLGWVLTLPDDVNTGGDVNFTMSRWVLAFLLAAAAVVPGLCLSLAIAGGVLAVLRRRLPRSGLAAGSIAALAGLLTVAAALAVYSMTQR